MATSTRSIERGLVTLAIAAWLAGCSMLPGTPEPGEAPPGNTQSVDSKAAAKADAKAAKAAMKAEKQARRAEEKAARAEQKSRQKAGEGQVAVSPSEPVTLSEKNERLFAGALGALKAGQLDQAEQLFTELTYKEQSLSTPWVNLALIHMQRGDRERAEQALAKAIEINPANCPAHNQIAVLAREDGEFLEAEASYLACIEHSPRFRDAYLNLGILYELYLGRLADALAAYREFEALSEEPDRRVRGWVMDLERRLGNPS